MADIQANDLDAVILPQMTLRELLQMDFRESPGDAINALESGDSPKALFNVTMYLSVKVPLPLAQEVAREVMASKASQWGVLP